MKCIGCGKDSPFKERTGRKCPGCGKRFAFEPREGDPVTDAAFQHAVERVSANGAVRFLKDHLYYELCRTKRPKKAGRIGCGIVGALLLVVALLPKVPIQVRVIFVIFATIAAVVFATLLKKTAPIDKVKFENILALWTSAHGAPQHMVAVKERRPARRLESDVGDYSFDRAVVTDRAETAELLLANNFHFENNCAVLSVDGYPPAIFEMVREMLRKNRRLHVFALHDASPTGCRLARRLAHDRHWFRDHVGVVDVGLRPEQAKPFQGLLQSSETTVVEGEGISVADAAWLSRYTLELAAVRPEQTLKRLYKAVNRKLDQDQDSGGGNGGGDGGGTGSGTSSDGGSVETDSTSFSSDAGASEGSADGFG